MTSSSAPRPVQIRAWHGHLTLLLVLSQTLHENNLNAQGCQGRWQTLVLKGLHGDRMLTLLLVPGGGIFGIPVLLLRAASACLVPKPQSSVVFIVSR